MAWRLSWYNAFFSLEIIIIVIRGVERRPDPNIFLWIDASFADAPAVTPNDIKAPSANGLSTFYPKCKPVFSNGSKSLPKSPPDCFLFYAIEFLIISH